MCLVRTVHDCWSLEWLAPHECHSWGDRPWHHPRLPFCSLGTHLMKLVGQPAYILGKWQQLRWCATYVKDCVGRIETDFGLDGDLYTHCTPLPEGCHPKLDKSAPLSEDEIHLYQTLISIAQWAGAIERLDIAFTVLSLNRFAASPPRTHHLKMAYLFFGFLKENPNRQLLLFQRMHFLEDYPDTSEGICRCPSYHTGY